MEVRSPTHRRISGRSVLWSSLTEAAPGCWVWSTFWSCWFVGYSPGLLAMAESVRTRTRFEGVGVDGDATDERGDKTRPSTRLRVAVRFPECNFLKPGPASLRSRRRWLQAARLQAARLVGGRLETSPWIDVGKASVVPGGKCPS